MNNGENKDLRCAFCGAPKDKVPVLVRSDCNAAFIAICPACAVRALGMALGWMERTGREQDDERHED